MVVSCNGLLQVLAYGPQGSRSVREEKYLPAKHFDWRRRNCNGLLDKSRTRLPRPLLPGEALRHLPGPRHYCYDGNDDGGGDDDDGGEQADELSYVSAHDFPRPEPIPRYGEHARRDGGLR